MKKVIKSKKLIRVEIDDGEKIMSLFFDAGGLIIKDIRVEQSNVCQNGLSLTLVGEEKK